MAENEEIKASPLRISPLKIPVQKRRMVIFPF